MVKNSKNTADNYNKKDEFAANITHELKTPLTSIIGFIELLKKDGGKSKKTRDYFYNIIDSEAQRLLHLIDDMLLLSQVENLADDKLLTQKCDIKKEIERSIKHLMDLTKNKNIQIHTNIGDNLFISAPSTRIQQLFSNLIGNAIKYNVENGQIFIKSFLEDNKVITKIRDTGIGIESEHINKIFNRFYRVKTNMTSEISGNGLGLSIVKDIVTLYDGDIQVKSEIGQGSEFTISFKSVGN